MARASTTARQPRWREVESGSAPTTNATARSGLPGPLQSNNAGELVAVYQAALLTPSFDPPEIRTYSKYVLEGLTRHLRTWEDRGWVGVKNADLFRATAYAARHPLGSSG